ncbi:hypothetical protein Cgig2_021719 [Carnegiea gigantea]|uniref:Uncharacterized protein n=1 Tax=Carnegiea gigantea TaxID=171969 RepID=A0A9Q1GY04_9CARY|nr:hypothetical protein Cgig2_021719 [Carnegiea gigantea]
MTTYLPVDASLPTGKSGYHLPVTQNGTGRYLGRTGARDLVAAPHRGQWPSLPLLPLLIQPIPGKPPSLKNKSRLPNLGVDLGLPPMTTPPKPQNARKYCEFYEQSGDTTTECRELKKALHELADKGQIDRFLKRGPHFLRREQEPVQPQPRDEEGSTEVVATIAGGYAEGMTRSAWKAQLRKAPRFASPHNDPLVVEVRIASAIVRSVDIITWDCLKKLTHPGRDIVPLVHPILGFGGQEVNPTGMIHIPVRFDDKLKAKNLEVDFLVVDVPMAYNVIIGRPTLHKNKEKEGGYISGSPLSSRPSSSEALASASKGLVTSSPAPSPSPEGGINSTSSGSRLAGARRRSGGRPRNSYPPEVLGPAPPRPCTDTLRYQHGPADSLTPQFEPLFQPPQSPQPWPLKAPPPASIAGLSSRPLGRLFQPSAFPRATGTRLLVPLAFGTLSQLLPLERTLLPLSPPPR